MTARARSEPARPVIRATIDLLTGSVRYDPWAVDDWDGERWVLEARARTLAEGRSVRWVLEKRGGSLVGCTHWWASRDALTDQYGAEAAARFFPDGEQRAEVVLEVPIPIEMEPTDRRRSSFPAPRRRTAQVSVGANT